MSSYFVHCQEVQLCLYCSLFTIGAQSVFLGQPGLSVPTHLYGQAVFTEFRLCSPLSLSISLSLSPQVHVWVFLYIQWHFIVYGSTCATLCMCVCVCMDTCVCVCVYACVCESGREA